MTGLSSSTASIIAPWSLETRPDVSMPASNRISPPHNAVPMSQKELDRLGRQRPALFTSVYVEIGFVSALLTSMMMTVCIPSLNHSQTGNTQETHNKHTPL